MNLPILSTGPQARMTSLEIAELVQSRHDSVKRTIERLATSGAIQLPPMVEVKNNQSLSQNSKTVVYVFEGEHGKRDSFVVVAQLSPLFTAKLVDRWIELEQSAIPRTLSEALRLAADLAERVEQQQARLTVAEVAPLSRRRLTAIANGSPAKRYEKTEIRRAERLTGVHMPDSCRGCPHAGADVCCGGAV